MLWLWKIYHYLPNKTKIRNIFKAHNEHNENNIAISPYGATSVLIAILEGLAGEAAYEIKIATQLPPDLSVVRIGLRDIHRHLKVIKKRTKDTKFFNLITFNYCELLPMYESFNCFNQDLIDSPQKKNNRVISYRKKVSSLA